jgi:hypothetical protein
VDRRGVRGDRESPSEVSASARAFDNGLLEQTQPCTDGASRAVKDAVGVSTLGCSACP